MSPTPGRPADPPAAQRVDPRPACPGRRYAAPRLRRLGTVDTLLDVLGPAQANYGGPMP
jgi:hypothetical protein